MDLREACQINSNMTQPLLTQEKNNALRKKCCQYFCVASGLLALNGTAIGLAIYGKMSGQDKIFGAAVFSEILVLTGCYGEYLVLKKVGNYFTDVYQKWLSSN